MRSEQVRMGIDRAPHRSLFRAAGLNDQDLEKPIIGIANSYNEFVPGHIHLDVLAKNIKEGIRAEGGTPLEFNTIAIDDGIAMGHEGMFTSLPSRETIADSVELVGVGHQIDGLVILSSCDKILPGMLMAGARLNLPTTVMTGGPMKAGNLHGEAVDLASVFEAVPKVKEGSMSQEEMLELERVACPGAGSCAGMFTANTMGCIVEAMGLSVPNTATLPATSEGRKQLAEQAGRAVMGNLNAEMTMGDFVTEESLRNGLRVGMALGGSTNMVLHSLALAKEAGLNFGLEEIAQLSAETPHLASMSPAGPARMEDLHRAGGVTAVMNSLSNQIIGSTPTIEGTTAEERLENFSPTETTNSIISSPADPVHPRGSIAILRGNLAPNGAVVKQTAVSEEMLTHSGPARIFSSEESATEAIDQGDINPGDVIVIRFEGPKGGPGMREMLTPTSRISGGNLSGKVSLITDGRFSGASRGPAIGHVSPEAAAGGPIGVIEEGERINIDVEAGVLEVEVSDRKLQSRMEEQKGQYIPSRKTTCKALSRYAALVTGAEQGAVLRCSNKSGGEGL